VKSKQYDPDSSSSSDFRNYMEPDPREQEEVQLDDQAIEDENKQIETGNEDEMDEESENEVEEFKKD